MNTIITTKEIKLDTKPERTKAAKAVFVYRGKIGVYASVTDTALALNVDHGSISKACHGKCNHVKGNYMCFVKDMPEHALDIVNAMTDYCEIKTLKAKEQRKEEFKRKVAEAQKELDKVLGNIEQLQEEYKNL